MVILWKLEKPEGHGQETHVEHSNHEGDQNQMYVIVGENWSYLLELSIGESHALHLKERGLDLFVESESSKGLGLIFEYDGYLARAFVERLETKEER